MGADPGDRARGWGGADGAAAAFACVLIVGWVMRLSRPLVVSSRLCRALLAHARPRWCSLQSVAQMVPLRTPRVVCVVGPAVGGESHAWVLSLLPVLIAQCGVAFALSVQAESPVRKCGFVGTSCWPHVGPHRWDWVHQMAVLFRCASGGMPGVLPLFASAREGIAGVCCWS